MSRATNQSSSRTTDARAFVPNTVTRQRFIIRTRAQAEHLKRQPLQDTLTNSPTKPRAQPSSTTDSLKDSLKPSQPSRKRALSPAQNVAGEKAAKRLKPLVFGSSAKPVPASRPVASLPPRHGTTARPSKPKPLTAHLEPSIPPAGPRDTPSQDVFEFSSRRSAVANHTSLGSSVAAREDPFGSSVPSRAVGDAQLMLPAHEVEPNPSLVDRVEDNASDLPLPSKPSVHKDELHSLGGGASMIPRRVPSSSAIPQPKITSFFKPPPALSSSSSTQPSITRNGGSLHVDATRPSKIPTSPSKRSVSFNFSSSDPALPSRPSTSLGFSSDSRRRTSLASTTQASLSNLTSALEKLSMPRARASLGGASFPGARPSGPTSAAAPVRPSPSMKAGSSQAAGIARRPAPYPVGGRPSIGTGQRRPITGTQISRGTSRGVSAPSGRRTLPSMGPPPARSAALAVQANATAASAIAAAVPSFSSPGASSPIAAVDGSMMGTSPPGDASNRSNWQRFRRASIASRSLADGSNSPNGLTDNAEAAASGAHGNIEKKAKKLTVLKDCVVFVDVKMEDGTDAGEVFVDMLKGLGARVITRLTPSVTHIVFKTGSPTTLSKHKLFDEPKPLLVGISWVVECAEKQEKVDESRFVVDEAAPVVAPAANKRRKSMIPSFATPETARSAGFPGSESALIPCSLAIMEEEEPAETDNADKSITPSSSGSSSSSLAPLERARKRKMTFAPKISSPLKATFRPADPDSDDEL